MTPERKKYLASISEDERVIREQLYLLKRNITWYKRFLRADKFDKCAKEDIRITKITIKALKKQLPAPILAGETCSVCDFSHEDSLIFPSYCACCGQKLR